MAVQGNKTHALAGIALVVLVLLAAAGSSAAVLPTALSHMLQAGLGGQESEFLAGAIGQPTADARMALAAGG